MDEAKVVQVIYCTKTRRGKGTTADPVRVITEILNLDGTLIMENDSEKKFTKKHLASFFQYILRSESSGNKLIECPVEGLINGWVQSYLSE